MKTSQANRLLEHFKKGKKINRLSALVKLGIFELSARIIDLEHLGYTINRHNVMVKNRFGEKVRVTEYWI